MKEDDLIDLAHKIAQRSPVRRFQTGAVIEKNDRVLGTGWSHASDRNMACYRSMHAELHALSRCDARDTTGSTIAIVTLSRKSGNRTDGTPCLFCLRNIQKFGIEKIICTTSGGGQKVIYADMIDMNMITQSIDMSAKKLYVSSVIQAC
jgi:deoxycytidylate deaminase